MILGVDYLAGCTHPRGIGRYGRELVRALARIEGGPELRLIDWGRPERSMPPEALGLDGAQVPVRRLSKRLPRAPLRLAGRWGLTADRLLGGCDLFLRSGPGWPPVGRVPTAVPVSELPPEGSEAEARVAEQLRGEDAWIVFSEEGERRLVEGLHLPRERVVRLPVGCDHWQREGHEPLPFPKEPTWLVLGGMRTDREPIRILEAFEALHAEGIVARLVFLGPAGDASEAFTRRLAFAAAREHVTWRETEDEARMLDRMGEATLLVHLSRDELTPVTPLEALRSGRGAVVSDLPAFHEALGDRVGYAPPAGGVAGREGLAAVLRERTRQASELDPARQRLGLARGFGWARHAEAFAATFSGRLEQGSITAR